MREIKFRAWDEKQKYMAYQGTPDLETIQSFMYHFGDQKIMQYTGFKDFYGKEIFEGDILEYVPYTSSLLKKRELVEFDVECGGWYVNKSAETLSNLLFWQNNEAWQIRQGYTPSVEKKVRIIGNIFENPQLLKK